MTYTRWPLPALWKAIDGALAKDDAEALWGLRESVNPKARGRLMSMSAIVVRAVLTAPLPMTRWMCAFGTKRHRTS